VAREATSLAPGRTSGLRARMRRHPSFDPTVTPERTAEEEILIESWKATFVNELPEVLPPAAEEEAAPPHAETEPMGAEPSTDSVEPPAPGDGEPVAETEQEDTTPKKYMLWPWSRKHLIAPQDVASGPTLEPEMSAAEPIDVVAEEEASPEMTAEPEPLDSERLVSEPAADVPVEQVDLSSTDTPEPASSPLDQASSTNSDSPVSIDLGSATLIADQPIDEPAVELPVEPEPSGEDAPLADEQRPARRRWLRRGARRDAQPLVAPPTHVEDTVEPMAVAAAPPMEAVAFPDPPPVGEPQALEPVQPAPVEEVPAVEAAAVVEPAPVEEVPAVEAAAVVAPAPVEEVPAVEGVTDV
jgi:hypothetical protein